MCTGAEVGLILAASSAAAGGINADQAARKQDKSNAAGILQQSEKRREANGVVQQTVNKIAGSQARDFDPSADFVSQLRRNASTSPAAPSVVGSSRYGADSAAAQGSVGDYGSALAKVFGATAAPSLQRQAEGFGVQRAASDLGRIQGDAAGDNFVSQLRTRSITPNPWVDTLAKVGQNVGGYMALQPAYAAHNTLGSVGSGTILNDTSTINPSLWDLIGKGAPRRAYG